MDPAFRARRRSSKFLPPTPEQEEEVLRGIPENIRKPLIYSKTEIVGMLKKCALVEEPFDPQAEAKRDAALVKAEVGCPRAASPRPRCACLRAARQLTRSVTWHALLVCKCVSATGTKLVPTHCRDRDGVARCARWPGPPDRALPRGLARGRRP